MSEPEPVPEPVVEPVVGPVVEPVVAESEWQRLDPRMLLVHPVKEVVRFLPVLVGVWFAGSAAGSSWQLLGVAVPVALGVLRYLTTSFRVAHDRVELRRGLLERHVLSTPVDRVRTVDLTASPVHRVLGLTTMRVGTGTASSDDDEQLDLDGLPVERARRLRDELLRAAPSAPGAEGDLDAEGRSRPPAPAAPPVLVLDAAWARYAPLTSAGLVLAAAVVGGGLQLLQVLGGLDRIDVDGVARDVATAPLLALAAVAVGLGLVVVAGLAVVAYLVSYWGFSLRRSGASWHLVRGLLTTRETSLDDARLHGVTLTEPVGLRLAGGAGLSAIVTGLRSEGGAASALLTPPAPYAVVAATAAAVVDDAEPVTGPLVPHGPRATRRAWVRACAPALVLAGLVVAGVLADLPGTSSWLLLLVPVLLVGGALLGRDRARSLGHALTARHLVARRGSVVRRRDVLAREAVIGWTLRATWLQRRAGLCSLVATTAGGRQSVVVADVPRALAVRLAASARPGLLEQFLLVDESHG